MECVEIFIDAEYVLQSLRSLYGKPYELKMKKEDFKWANFIKYILKNRDIRQVNYYTARLDEVENKETYDAQTVFLERIKQSLSAYNIQMRLGKMIKIKNKTKKTWNEQREQHTQFVSWGQKGIDTKIILDICRYAYESADNAPRTALLVSGDEDFSEALELLREKHIRTEVIVFNRRDTKGFSKPLQEASDSFTVLSYEDCRKHNIL